MCWERGEGVMVWRAKEGEKDDKGAKVGNG